MAQLSPRSSESSDPLRTALRQAIEAAEVARTRLVAHEAAIEKARTIVQASEEKYEAALTELASVKARYAGAIAAHAGGTKHTPPSGVPQARIAVEAAEDEGEGATAALKKLLDELPGLSMAHWAATADVEVRILAMLAPVAHDLLEEVQKLESALAMRRAALAVMLENDLINQGPDELRRFDLRQQCYAVFDSELRQRIIRLFRPPLDADKSHALETTTAWRRAREALRVDATAALPAIER